MTDPGIELAPQASAKPAMPDAMPDARPLPPRWKIVRAKLKIYWISILNVLYMMFRTKIVFRFWWYRMRGREEEIGAITRFLAQHWAAGAMKLFGTRIEVIGQEHVPRTGPLVVVCNHQALYDIPVLIAYLGREVGFVMKRELWRVPGLSFWMRQIHCAGIDRSDSRSALGVFDTVAQDMRDRGWAMVIFPEGTRTKDREHGTLGPFRRGSLQLALRYGFPILPVTVEGTRHISNPVAMARTAHGGRLVRLKIDPPVVAQAAGTQEAKAFVDGLREQIAANQKALRVEWPAP